MTDVVEKMEHAIYIEAEGCFSSGCSERSLSDAALSTLTPGSTWATEDGVEVMVVPVEATREVLLAGENVLADHAVAIMKRKPDGTFNPQYPEQYARTAWESMLSAIRKE